MTSEKVSEKLESIIDELTSIKEKHDEFDFAIVVTWTKEKSMTMEGDCAITQMEKQKFDTMLENLIHTYNQQKNKVNYYGNDWLGNDNTIN